MFALIVRPEEVGERERREVRAQGDSPERLLVNWINECLYVHEIEGFVVHRVEVDACTETVVHGGAARRRARSGPPPAGHHRQGGDPCTG